MPFPKQTVTIRNSVHQTTATARATKYRYWCSELHLNAEQVAQIRDKLCGLPDCHCGGGFLGECGPQDYYIRREIDRSATLTHVLRRKWGEADGHTMENRNAFFND